MFFFNELLLIKIKLILYGLFFVLYVFFIYNWIKILIVNGV